MSRNPVLTDSAFGLDSTSASPAEEWRRAQARGAGTATSAPPPTAPPPTGARAPVPGAPSSARGPVPGRGPAGVEPPPPGGKVMTMGGVASATLVMFVFILLGAWWGWTQVSPSDNPVPGGPQVTAELNSPVVLFVCLFAAFGLAILTVFKPKLARFTAVPYALLEGVVLGMISALYNAQFEGIVAQAILATFGVFVAMAVLYGLRILRATPKFVKGVVGATAGIMVLYLGSFIFSLFSGGMPTFLTDASPLSIGISVVIVIVAALNLILDFDFIERGSEHGLPAYMDWYAAFGLVLTLVWLYLEMLRLISKLRQ